MDWMMYHLPRWIKEERKKSSSKWNRVPFSLQRDLTQLVIKFFHDVILFANYFSAEVCDFALTFYYSIVGWKPNDSKSKRRAVQDCFWRVLSALKVNLTISYCTDNIQKVGVPLLCSVELPALRIFWWDCSQLDCSIQFVHQMIVHTALCLTTQTN